MNNLRKEFERFCSQEMNVEEMDLHRCNFPMTPYEKQPYACHETERSWWTWQACAALQSHDREDALRYRWLRQAGVDYSTDIDVVDAEGCCLNGEDLDAAIDHARCIEEE